MKYVDEFLCLRACGDIINIVSPITNHAKEISESMAVITRLRKIVLKHPMEYTLYDLCAGNALTSIIATFLLPVKNSIAIDKFKRNRKWEKARRFQYIEQDIYQLDVTSIEKKSIIISIHPCKKLAQEVIKIYNKSAAEYLVLMPCCNGKTIINAISLNINKYYLWCIGLSTLCDGYTVITVDDNCSSPKNCLVIAKKFPDTEE